MLMRLANCGRSLVKAMVFALTMLFLLPGSSDSRAAAGVSAHAVSTDLN